MHHEWSGASVAHTHHKTDTERLDTSNLTKRNNEYDLIPRKNEPRDVADLNSAVPVPSHCFRTDVGGFEDHKPVLFFLVLGWFEKLVSKQ